jgi:hypothetical protein
VTQFCNPYGSENPGGHAVLFGGLLAGQNRVADQWHCDQPAVHRFRWRCECGHLGSIVSLCEGHYAQLNGRQEYRDGNGRVRPVPANLRRDVQACPRCASLAPTPEQQHKCKVRLVSVS